MVTDWGIEPIHKSGMLHTEIEGSVVRENFVTLHGNYYGFFDGLYQSITKGTVEPVTAQDGIDVMRIIEAAIISNLRKAVLVFNPTGH